MMFAPTGGMNQDDSIITPTPDTAGRNAFGLGDYKYALNARIGSSKSDNFGDVENLRDTVEKTTYYVRAVVNSNPLFASGLTGWSQLAVSGGTAWAFSGGVVKVSGGVGAASYVSDILYQTAPSSKRVGLRVKFKCSSLAYNVSAYLVYLNGTTVISTDLIAIDTINFTFTDRIISKYISKELPVGCTNIGFQIRFSSDSGENIEVQALQFFDWTSGSKPAGNEKVIGKYVNKEFNLLYYHVYNDAGNHCIRYYNPVTDAIYELLKWSGLSYASTYFESSAMVDNYMAITDRNNAPRIIDVYAISDLYLILGSDFREFHISFHRWAPTLPPVVRAYYDTVTNNYKKFQGKTIQFAYRQIYQGHLKSRWSPTSSVTENFDSNSGNQITSIEIFIPGSTLDVPGAGTQYNYFNNDDVKFTSVVESVEIAYREGARDVWRLLKRYSVKDSGNTSFYYSGDSNSTPVPTDDFYQLFDTVPFLAGTVEAIDNRFMFADCLDEKDAAPSVQVSDVSVVKFDVSQMLNNWWNYGTNNAGDMATAYSGMTGAQAADLGLRNMINDSTFKSRGKYKPGIIWLAENGWRSAVYTSEDWSFEIPEETTIVDKLYALCWKFPASFIPPSWAVGYEIVLTNCLNIDYFMFGAANSFSPLIDGTAIVTNTQIPQDIRDRIRQHFENARLVTGMDYGQYLTTLENKPFFHSLASDVRKTVLAASLTAASRLFIDVNNWFNSSDANVAKTSNNPLNNLFYNYREGDRVRFLGSTLSATPTASQKVIFDVPILEYTGLGIVIEKPAGLLWVPIGVTVGSNQGPSDLLIEVYTPKLATKDSDFLYYSRGEWYPVLYPGTDQRDMAKRDWTFTNTAGVTCSTYGDIRVFNKRPFSNGDCHGILKTFYFNILSDAITKSVSAYTASMNPDPNKSFDFWERNDGRTYAAYTDLPVVKFKTTQIRFGGQIVEQSFVNQLTRFREEYQKIFPSEYGRIRALVNISNAQVESVGSILLAIGERETFSIYVNRTTFEDLAGSTQVALSDRILGSYNTLLGSHGTFNPESVSLDRGRVYYWDALNGSWIRYGRDGLTEISQYKMRTWFREIGQLLITLYTGIAPKVISEFDTYNEELVLFMNHSTLPSTFRGYAKYKGAMFSEEDKRWKSIHSYEPEMFANINNHLISFVDGKLYLHEQGAAYNTFYGVKQDVMIEPVFNEQPQSMKSHQAISIVSTDGWSVDRFLSEYRGTKTKQQSSISLLAMKLKEDGYYAAILNDVNTPVVVNPLITGNKMRSRAVRALLKLDPAVVTLSLLHYVNVGEIDSPKNSVNS